MSDSFFEHSDATFVFCSKSFNAEVAEPVESDLARRSLDEKKVTAVVIYSVVRFARRWYVIKISCFSECAIVEWSIEVWIISLLI